MSKWTKEDKSPHLGVAAVIENGQGHVLVQDHKKLGKWSLPGGKGDITIPPQDTLRKELKEELGIDVKEFEHLTTENYDATRDNLKFTIPIHLYRITKYDGEIQNVEKEKHPEQSFKDLHKLVLSGDPVSHSIDMFLRHKRKQK